jgi:hypothetical protein
MPELWRIRFMRDGQALPVASASARNGILFADDGSDIFGRAAAVRIVGLNDDFQRNLRAAQTMHGARRLRIDSAAV